MYDELVKKIRHCATDPMHCLTCAEDKDGRCFKRLMTQAADAIEEMSVVVRTQKAALDKFPRWIPVAERLPCLTTPVLATDGIEVDIAWMYGVPPRWITSYTAIDEDKLTHWMPLPKTPQPPKEE